MNNMLADAMVDAMQGWRNEHGSFTVISFDISVKPDVKKFRPGMPMDTLSVKLRCIDDVNVKISVTRTTHTGAFLTENGHEATWDLSRHFLRGLLAATKPFIFNKRDPFFTVTRDDGHKQTV